MFVVGDDARVAAWLFAQAGATPRPFDLATGIADASGRLVGGFVFTDWNGQTLQVHFWGPRALTALAVRQIFRAALEFSASAVIVKASKEHMARGVRKLGAELVRPNHEHGEFIFPRDRMQRLAGLKET